MKKDELIDYIFELYEHIEKLPTKTVVKNNDPFENVKTGSVKYKVKDKLINTKIKFKVTCDKNTHRGTLKLSSDSAVITIGKEKLVVNLSNDKITLINTFDTLDELLLLNIVQPIIKDNCTTNLTWSVEP